MPHAFAVTSLHIELAFAVAVSATLEAVGQFLDAGMELALILRQPADNTRSFPQ